jgi:hypothetical protein
MVQEQPSIIFDHLGIRVDRKGTTEANEELPLEVLPTSEAGAELLMEGRPWHQSGLALWNAMKPLREPCVSIQRHGGWCQSRDGAMVQRDGMALQAVVELPR